MFMLHVLVHVHGECPCLCCMSMSMLLHVNFHRCKSVSMSILQCPCPCCLSMPMLLVSVHCACPFPWCISRSVSVLHVRVFGTCPYPCKSCIYRSMLHVHIYVRPCPCEIFMSMLHVRYMLPVLHTHFCMSALMLQVHVHVGGGVRFSDLPCLRSVERTESHLEDRKVDEKHPWTKWWIHFPHIWTEKE
jgi:hypothetical protein